MKKIYTSLFAILIVASVSHGQVLMDGGFEAWGYSRIIEGGCDCDTLPNWKTNWQYGLEDQTAQLSEEAHGGSSSVLVTRSDYEVFPLSQTFPYSSFSHDALQGYYRTELVMGDSASVAVVYKKGGKNLSRDIIYFSKDTTEWAFFQIMLSENSNADSVSVQIVSSYSDETSKIWVDDLKFDKFVSLDAPEKAQFSVFPNPAQTHITVEMVSDNGSSEPLNVTLMDVTGRSVKRLFSGNTAQTQMTFNLDGVQPGLYFVKVDRSGKQALQSVVIR